MNQESQSNILEPPTEAQTEALIGAFEALGPKISKNDLLDFLSNTLMGDFPLAVELVYEHYTGKRPINVNGCHCRPDYGEGCTACSSWHHLFHGDKEVEEAPPISYAIDGFLQNDAITMIGGLPGHGKTWVMLSMVKALLEGTPLFGYKGFAVKEPSKRVVYLCPESSLTPFAHRLKLFGLNNHVRGPGHGKLFLRTISVDNDKLTLDDIRLRHAIDGADVFLDTAIRFMDGDENSASDQREFGNTLFRLLGAGARTITAAHHAPKGSENIAADRMTLETILRGTGELGAMVATCWALKQIDSSTNTVYVKNVKARDFEACQPFVLGGRPHISDHGDFIMAQPPGMAVAPAVQKHTRTSDRLDEARALRKAGKSTAEIAAQVGVSDRQVRRWKLGADIQPDIADIQCPGTRT